MRQVTFRRWIFGLALLPAAAWAWIMRGVGPDAHALDLPLSVAAMYAVSVFAFGLLRLVSIAVADVLRDAWEVIAWVVGMREEP